LVVDDDETLLELLDKLLEFIGFVSTGAVNGQLALDEYRRALSTRPYTIILAGIHMPVMNGLQFGRAIRRIDTDIPMVAMSGYVTWRNETDASSTPMGVGYDLFLEKPFTLFQLQHAILMSAMKHNCLEILEKVDFHALWAGPSKEP
jgi:CheY-like chemotaxis protein